METHRLTSLKLVQTLERFAKAGRSKLKGHFTNKDTDQSEATALWCRPMIIKVITDKTKHWGGIGEERETQTPRDLYERDRHQHYLLG